MEPSGHSRLLRSVLAIGSILVDGALGAHGPPGTLLLCAVVGGPGSSRGSFNPHHGKRPTNEAFQGQWLPVLSASCPVENPGSFFGLVSLGFGVCGLVSDGNTPVGRQDVSDPQGGSVTLHQLGGLPKEQGHQGQIDRSSGASGQSAALLTKQIDFRPSCRMWSQREAAEDRSGVSLALGGNLRRFLPRSV